MGSVKRVLAQAPPLLHAPISLSNEAEALAASALAQAASPGSHHRRYLSTGCAAQVLRVNPVPEQARVRLAGQKAPSPVARPMELCEDVAVWLVDLRFCIPTCEPGHPAMG